MGAHRCSCLFDVFSPIHPFIEINIGFKRRSLSDCSTLGWIVFDFFAIHLYKGWRTPSAWQTLGLQNALRNHFNDGQQQSYKPKHVLDGLSLVVVGTNPSSAWWRLDVFKVSFVCKIGYIMQNTKLLFLLHAPPLECNSCALANLTHHWGESPALTFIFMTIRDKTSKPQDLPMTWDDQPFYFWRQLNAHFTYNLGSPAFKLIEK